MGEKGGKKDKNKADKQKAQQQEKKKTEGAYSPALAPDSNLIRHEPFARPAHTDCEPNSHQHGQPEQYPESEPECSFAVHRRDGDVR